MEQPWGMIVAGPCGRNGQVDVRDVWLAPLGRLANTEGSSTFFESKAIAPTVTIPSETLPLPATSGPESPTRPRMPNLKRRTSSKQRGKGAQSQLWRPDLAFHAGLAAS